MEPPVEKKNVLDFISSKDPVLNLARNITSGIVSGYKRSIEEKALARGFKEAPDIGLVRVEGEEGGVELEEPVKRQLAAEEAAKAAQAFRPNSQSLERLMGKLDSGDYTGAVGELIADPGGTVGFLAGQSSGQFLEAQALSLLPGPGTYMASFGSAKRADMASAINEEVRRRGGETTDPDAVLDVLSDKDFLNKTAREASKGATALASTEVAVELLAGLATGGLGALAPQALTRPLAKAVMRMGSEMAGESLGATAQQVAKGEEITPAHNLLEGLSTIGQSFSTVIGAEALEGLAEGARKDRSTIEQTFEEEGPDELDKPRKAAEHALRWAEEQGADVSDLRQELEAFEKTLTEPEKQQATKEVFKSVPLVGNVKTAGFNPESLHATAKVALEKLLDLERRFATNMRPSKAYNDAKFLRKTVEKTLPSQAQASHESWSGQSSQPAARQIVQAYEQESEKKQEMIEALRERFGERIPIFRGGSIRAEYQSWSTDPQLGFQFGGTSRKETRKARPFIQGFVRPEDVAFVGVSSEWELVVDSGKVQELANTSIQEYRNKLADLFEGFGFSDLREELNARTTLPYVRREEFPTRQVVMEPGQERREADTVQALITAEQKGQTGIIGDFQGVEISRREDGMIEVLDSETGFAAEQFPNVTEALDYINESKAGKVSVESLMSQVAPELTDPFEQTPFDPSKFRTAGVNLEGEEFREGKTQGEIPDQTQGELAEEESRLLPPPEPEDLSGLNRAVIARWRRNTGLDQLPGPKRRAHLTDLREAIRKGIPERAEELSQGFVRDPRPLTSEEVLGIAYKKAELEQQHDQLMARADALVQVGRNEAAGIYKEQADQLNDRIDQIQRGTRASVTEVARSLSSVGRLFDTRSMTLSSIRRDARVSRGRPLKAAEESQLNEAFKKLKAAEKRESELLGQLDQAEWNMAQTLAEKAVKERVREAQREGKRVSLEERRDQIQAERAEILKQLGRKGFRLQSSLGIDPETAWLVAKLANTYIKEGVVGIEALTNKILERLPDLSREDVMEGIALMGKGQVKEATEETKKEIKDWQKQDDILKAFEEVRKKDPTKAKEMLNQMQNFASRNITDNERLLEIEKRIVALRDKISAGVPPPRPRGEPTPPSPKVQEKLDEVRDLEKLFRIEQKVADLQQQIATGFFKTKKRKKPRTATPVTTQLKQAQVRLAQAQRQVRRLTKGPTPFNWTDLFLEPIRLSRQLITTGEMSGALRQGLGLIMTQPTKLPTHFTQAFKSFFKEDVADEIEFMIQTSRWQPALQEMGVDFTYRQGLNEREELFMSKVLERVPAMKELLESNHPGVKKLLLSGPASVKSVVNAAERHMTTFLNLYRFSIATQYLENYGLSDLETAKKMGKLINDLSGRSNFKAGPGSFASIIAFAPRFTVSRFSAPARSAMALGNPQLRKQAAAGFARTAIWGASWLGLASLGGLNIGLDPEDSDFGKIIWGNTRIDIWGGFQQPYSWMLRMFFAGKQARDEDFEGRKLDGYDLLTRFSLYKASPAITLPLTLLTGKTPVGEEVSELETLGRAAVPLFLQDAVETGKKSGALAGAGAGVAAGLGLNVNTWGTALDQGDIKPLWNKAGYKPRSPVYPKEVRNNPDLKERYNNIFGALVAKKVRANKGVLDVMGKEALNRNLKEYASEARKIMKPWVDSKLSGEALTPLEEKAEAGGQ